MKLALAVLLGVAAFASEAAAASGINQCNGCSILNTPSFTAVSTLNLRPKKAAGLEGGQISAVQRNNLKESNAGDFMCNGCVFPGDDGQASTVCNGCVIKNSASDVSYESIINMEVAANGLLESVKQMPSLSLSSLSVDVPTYNIQQAYNYAEFNAEHKDGKEINNCKH